MVMVVDEAAYFESAGMLFGRGKGVLGKLDYSIDYLRVN